MKTEKADKQIILGAFRLDPSNECLWREGQTIQLAPKDFAVLLYLVEHPNRLVTKEELLDAVWPDTVVSDGVLKVSIRKLRQALGDDPHAPGFIATSHRRGYRFIGPVREERSQQQPWRLHIAAQSGLVGRAADLAQLHDTLAQAMNGERRVVFITGDAGIGKTALLESFLKEATDELQVWVARGQCLEQYGAGEAYLPVIEAISRLCRERASDNLVELLRNHAPTWLQQMPWLTTISDRKATLGASRERMLSEMAEMLEAAAARAPLVLALEDLHWGDYSTLDLVSYLARRREQARLLVVGTYRPVEALLNEHPIKSVKQELQVHNQCAELPLDFLRGSDVQEYLSARFPGANLPAELAQSIHSRTGGNPLFMVNAVDYLLVEGAIAQREGQWTLEAAVEKIEVGVPESIRQMIEKQIARLNKEQLRLLETAADLNSLGCSWG